MLLRLYGLNFAISLAHTASFFFLSHANSFSDVHQWPLDLLASLFSLSEVKQRHYSAAIMMAVDRVTASCDLGPSRGGGVQRLTNAAVPSRRSSRSSGWNGTPAQPGTATGAINDTSAVIRVRFKEDISHPPPPPPVTHDPLSGGWAQNHTHFSAACAHVEPVRGHGAPAGLKEKAEALNGWSVYREKKGGQSRCQIWNTSMLMPRVSSDETVDLFDTQQMIQRMHTNIQKTQICE